MTDAELCRRALAVKGWKQKELAAYLEMGEAEVSKAIHDTRPLPEGKRYLVADLIDMRPQTVRRLMATTLGAAVVVNLLLTAAPAEALTGLEIGSRAFCIMLSLLPLVIATARGLAAVPVPWWADRWRDTGRRHASRTDQLQPAASGLFLP